MEKQITLQIAQYLNQGSWKGLGLSKETCANLLRIFLEVCYRDLGTRPEKLDEPELQQALLEILPRRLTAKQEGVAKVPQLIGIFLKDLQQEHFNSNAWKFPSIIDAAEQQFPQLLKRLGGTAVSTGPGKTYERPGSKVGRNDPCPCGSGKKYKKCCFKELN